MLRRAVLMIAVGLAAPALEARAPADTTRTVYVSAVDRKGEPVTDLTAGDLVVKENGQVREITSLSRATERNHVAVLVDDGGEGRMDMPVAELLNAASGRAAFSISMLNPQAIVLNDYTTDQATLQRSISRLVQRGRLQRDLNVLSDAVAWTARGMRQRKLSRPVIVILTNAGDSQDREISRGILEELRSSRAALHVVRVVGADISPVLADGPKQSGGSETISTSTRGFAEAMMAIPRTLAYQYELTYVLPDGVKPNERLQITTTRPNLRIIAPTRIPDR